MKFFLNTLWLLFASWMMLPVAHAEEQMQVEIRYCGDLQNMALNLGGFYELTQDIDCAGVDFTPVGSITAPFYGGLNGNGYKIKHLYINKENQSNVGLFGYASSGSASFINLIFEDAVVIGGNYVGILAGYISGTGRLSNIHAQGSVEARATGTSSYAGGLIGYANLGMVNNVSYLSADVDVKAVGGTVGGLIGRYATSSSVWLDNSFATGSVSVAGTADVGGVGGLVGYGGRISNSYATGDVTTVNGYYVGGLVGSGGIVTNSYATGNVIGAGYIGGLVGSGSSSVSNSYATGDVTGTGSYVGGLAGYYSDVQSLSDSYATGNVTGDSRVGGLIGQTNYPGTLFSHNYSSGEVTGNSYVGGLVGESPSLNWISCYWDIEASGQPTSARGEGKTTAEMLDQSTYFGWDFGNVWDMRDGRSYPWLRAFGEADVDIGDCEALQNMAQNVEGSYRLVSDIDCAGVSFAPIGTGETPFEGRFEGAGYTISNLNIAYADETFVGLWGAVSGASLQNVRVEDVTIYGREYVGGLVGMAINNTDIKNAEVSGTIYSAGDHPSKGTIGGLVGLLADSALENSAAIVDINASRESASFMGGLVGESDSSEITNSYAKGSVYGDSYVGGLVGYSGGSTVDNTYAAVVVSGNEITGGLIGGANTTDVVSSYWDLEVSGHAVSAGGEGKTTVEMWQQSNYLNWDFVNLWVIEENQSYPYLRQSSR